MRTGHSLWDGQDRDEPGETVVRLRCAACGNLAATVEETARGGLRVLTGGVRYEHLGRVRCPVHGVLQVDWPEVKAKAEETRGTGRVARLAIPPNAVG